MIHLYCLAVQAGFYSDAVECLTVDQRVPGSILGWDMEIFLRVCDIDMALYNLIGQCQRHELIVLFRVSRKNVCKCFTASILVPI